MVVIDGKEVRSERPFPAERVDPKLCIFEFVYFARPDSQPLRQRGARRPAPDGPAARHPGARSPPTWSWACPTRACRRPRGTPSPRHPLRPGPGEEPLHRPHLHRPDPGRAGQRRAPQAQPAAREHRRQAARRGGRLDRPGHHHPGHGAACSGRPAPREVHLRISSPPFKWPCFYGIDTPDRDELLAAIKSLDEIAEFLDVDSLEYLTLEHLVEAIDAPGAGFCDACLTGDYPVPVPVRASATGRPERRPARPRPGVTPASSRPGPDRHAPAGPAATYAAAGVDIEAGDAGRRPHPPLVASTARPEVLGGLGGFGGLFALDTGRYANRSWWRRPTASGPRSLVAQAAGRFDTIGIDLVAMCVDDLVCQGRSRSSSSTTSRPARVDPARMAELVAGVAEGCRQVGAALLGGEMAEHPGVMAPGEFDLAGFAVGVVERDELLGPDRVAAPATSCSGWPRPGSAPTATRWPATCCSSGPASPSTVRPGPGRRPPLADELLRPSVLYTPAVRAALGRRRGPRRRPHHRRRAPRESAAGAPRRRGAVVERGAAGPVPRIFDEIRRLGRLSTTRRWPACSTSVSGMVVVVPPERRRRPRWPRWRGPAVGDRVGRVGPGHRGGPGRAEPVASESRWGTNPARPGRRAGPCRPTDFEDLRDHLLAHSVEAGRLRAQVRPTEQLVHRLEADRVPARGDAAGRGRRPLGRCPTTPPPSAG